MERWYRSRMRTTLGAMMLFLFIADPGSGETGSPGGRGPTLDSGGGKSVRLSLKISGAKKRKRQVSFYKSVARQSKIRPTVSRTQSTER